MITRTDFVSYDDTTLRLRTQDPSGCVFFDIETTGFRAASSHLYLIGLAAKENSGWKVTQFLAQKPAEEAQLLRSFAMLLDQCHAHAVISFNGDRFDIGYLREKYQLYGLEDPFEHRSSIDIYRDIRPLRPLLSATHMNQKSLERFLGLHRTDPYDGGKLIQVYRDYVRLPDPKLEDTLLLHNYEDVCGMFLLTQLYTYRAAIDTMPQSVRAAACGETAQLTFSLPCAVPVPVCWQSSWLKISLAKDTGTLEIPIHKGQMYCFFDNYKDYFYLPAEDQAIHKDVAIYVDKEHRRKATARTCYIRTEGCFLPQPRAFYTPALRRDYDDALRWFAAPEGFPDNAGQDFLQEYADMLLSSVRHH